jgi:hypothetical protein
MWLARLILAVFAVCSWTDAHAACTSPTPAPSHDLVADPGPAPCCAKVVAQNLAAHAPLAAAPTPAQPSAPFAFLYARFDGSDHKARLPKKAHAFAFSGTSPPVVV